MASLAGGGDGVNAEVNGHSGHHKKHHHSSKNHSHSSSKHHSSSKSSSSSKHHSSGHKSSHDSSHKSSHGSSGHKSSHDSSKHNSSSHSSSKHSSSKSSSSKSSHHSKDKHSSHSSSKDKHRAEHISSQSKVKVEPQSPIKHRKPVVSDDDDLPLNQRLDQAGLLTSVKDEKRAWSEDEEPLSARMEKVKKVKKEEPSERKRKVEEDDDYASPKVKKIKKESKTAKPEVKKGGRKKEEDDALKEDKWEWWKDEDREGGVKWVYLEHQGPMFAPAYEPLPSHVTFYYKGKPMKLSPDTEEVAGFYGKMLEHDYTTKDIFNRNFLKDWRKVMTAAEKDTITDLSKCNFREICDHFQRVSEERKNMSKEEKQKIKKQNEDIVKEYGFCVIDHHRQKIGNFRIEPPGLFRGRGDHPKQGMLKKRTQAEDVIINCSKDAPVPRPPPGHKWKEVRHDKTVTWLACWTENVQNSTKYVMLNAASKLKGEKDWKKYETARNLHRCVDKIRAQYREDFKSKEMRVRQRSVAMYFIDKLALRAGNEKDEDTADTVGCCSIRVEHIKLHEQLDGKENVVEFDFLGKDSIRYYNRVSVEKRVFKNLQLFMENKVEGDDLFDRLNTTVLNKHLQSLMNGLTAKVFRTYNASRTLQEQLNLLTSDDDNVTGKMLSYNRANRAVAILCNHQRAVPKNFSKQMENLQSKIEAKLEDVMKAKQDYKAAKADYKALKTEAKKKIMEKKKKAIERLQEQHHKLEVQQTDKDENKEIALGTSKLNYLDPRISVAWCKKHEVPIEKVYNKTQREKFAWAIDMADEDFEF